MLTDPISNPQPNPSDTENEPIKQEQTKAEEEKSAETTELFIPKKESKILNLLRKIRPDDKFARKLAKWDKEELAEQQASFEAEALSGEKKIKQPRKLRKAIPFGRYYEKMGKYLEQEEKLEKAEAEKQAFTEIESVAQQAAQAEVKELQTKIFDTKEDAKKIATRLGETDATELSEIEAKLDALAEESESALRDFMSAFGLEPTVKTIPTSTETKTFLEKEPVWQELSDPRDPNYQTGLEYKLGEQDNEVSFFIRQSGEQEYENYNFEDLELLINFKQGKRQELETELRQIEAEYNQAKSSKLSTRVLETKANEKDQEQTALMREINGLKELRTQILPQKIKIGDQTFGYDELKEHIKDKEAELIAIEDDLRQSEQTYDKTIGTRKDTRALQAETDKLDQKQNSLMSEIKVLKSHLKPLSPTELGLKTTADTSQPASTESVAQTPTSVTSETTRTEPAGETTPETKPALNTPEPTETPQPMASKKDKTINVKEDEIGEVPSEIPPLPVEKIKSAETIANLAIDRYRQSYDRPGRQLFEFKTMAITPLKDIDRYTLASINNIISFKKKMLEKLKNQPAEDLLEELVDFAHLSPDEATELLDSGQIEQVRQEMIKLQQEILTNMEQVKQKKDDQMTAEEQTKLKTQLHQAQEQANQEGKTVQDIFKKLDTQPSSDQTA